LIDDDIEDDLDERLPPRHQVRGRRGEREARGLASRFASPKPNTVMGQSANDIYQGNWIYRTIIPAPVAPALERNLRQNHALAAEGALHRYMNPLSAKKTLLPPLLPSDGDNISPERY